MAPVLLFGVLSLLAPDLPRQAVNLHQGWETEGPPMPQWAKNGESVERSNGPTEEQAFEGRRSFKLDVELKGGSYHYFALPFRLPVAAPLKLTAQVWVAAGTTAQVGFGTNFVFPPTHHSGCSPAKSFAGPTGGWKPVEIDLRAEGEAIARGVLPQHTANVRPEDVGVVLDRVGLFILGGAGQRAIVYVDDVRIVGEAPEVAAYERWAAARFEAARARLRQRLEGWRRELAAAQAAIAELPEQPALARYRQVFAAAATEAGQRLAAADKRGYVDASDKRVLEQTVGLLKHGPATLRAVAAAQQADRPLVLFAAPAVTNNPPVLGRFPLPAPPADSLALSACRGEYEAVTLVAYALRPLKGLRVEAADLKQGERTIPAAAVDVRQVKCWYQAGYGIADLHHKHLTAELLLKDDALVRVDQQAQQNYLRHTAPEGQTSYRLCSGPTSDNLTGIRPLDAATLQPATLSAEELRQYWLTVHVPDDAAAGDYRGAVTIAWDGGRQTIDLTVTVHPFELRPSRLLYSIYYRACLAPDGQPRIDSELRSEEQYRAEMADLKAHGVLYPTNYQGWDERLLTRALEIRREVGLPGGPFFNLGRGTGSSADAATLAALRADHQRWTALCRRFGYDTLYYYGQDEATGDALTAQKAAWEAVQAAGGRTFVACYHKTFEAMGKRLNLAVLAGRPDPAEAAKWHSVGSLAFCYANPQVGEELPETYRRNFGLLLWKAGFDGAMDYAYQHGFHHVWNDFDDETYRDHNFSYPTVNGVVPTVQWAGFREAVDDVRYVTTLEEAMAQAPATKATEAQAAKEYLATMDADGADLAQTRAELVRWILKLR